jgi:hypothetical protein
MVPVFDVYWFHSHEWGAYVVRTVQFAKGLRAGDPYPRWCPDFYGGYGSPFFVFYAPLTYVLGGLVTLVTGMPTLALKIVAALGSLGAGLGVYCLVARETRRTDAALLAAFAYLSMPYRITDFTVRGDLAEFFALALLPWVLLGYRELVHESDPRKLAQRAFVAALLHAALVAAHTLLGLWGTGLTLLVALASALQLWRRRTLTRLVLVPVVFAGALALSCAYWLPALVERPLVRIEAMGEGYYAPEHNWLRLSELAKAGQFQIAPLLVLAAGLALVGLVKRPRITSEWYWLAGALGLVVLVLPQASVIWKKDLIPFGRLLQFPWRLLGPAALCGAVALGVAWAKVLPRRLWADLAAVALAACAYGTIALNHVTVRNMPPSEVQESSSRIREIMTGTTGVDEYLPRTTAKPPQGPATTLASSTPWVDVVETSSRHSSHALELVARQATSLELSLHYYPGWLVETLAGPERVAVRAGKSGRVELSVPRAGRYRVNVSFGTTPIRRLAWLISLAALAGLPLGAGILVARACRVRSGSQVQRAASQEVLA